MKLPVALEQPEASEFDGVETCAGQTADEVELEMPQAVGAFFLRGVVDRMCWRTHLNHPTEPNKRSCRYGRVSFKSDQRTESADASGC